MTTQFSLADSLPKDAGGARFAAWTDLGTSQLDFSLPGGIGAKVVGGKITSALWSGNGLAGSKIEPTGGVGNLMMAHWSSAASATATQNGIHIRANDRGEFYQSQLATTTCVMSGSTEMVTLASGIIYSAIIAACGAVSGGQVAIMNGAVSLAHLVFSGPNETIPVVFGTGACFGNLKFERRNTVGTVYASFAYKNYGQI